MTGATGTHDLALYANVVWVVPRIPRHYFDVLVSNYLAVLIPGVVLIYRELLREKLGEQSVFFTIYVKVKSCLYKLSVPHQNGGLEVNCDCNKISLHVEPPFLLNI